MNTGDLVNVPITQPSYTKRLKHFIAQVVDDFAGEASGFGIVECA
jgi:hypothetical protein